jgi:hypothetical protein
MEKRDRLTYDTEGSATQFAETSGLAMSQHFFYSSFRGEDIKKSSRASASVKVSLVNSLISDECFAAMLCRHWNMLRSLTLSFVKGCKALLQLLAFFSLALSSNLIDVKAVSIAVHVETWSQSFTFSR